MIFKGVTYTKIIFISSLLHHPIIPLSIELIPPLQ